MTWRKRMGIEPTTRHRRACGFEDRGGHQAPIASTTATSRRMAGFLAAALVAWPARAQAPPDVAAEFAGRVAFGTDGTRIGVIRRVVRNRAGQPTGLLVEVEDGVVIVPFQQVSRSGDRVILPLSRAEARALPRLPLRD